MEIQRIEDRDSLELTLKPQAVLNAENASALEREIVKARKDIWCTVKIDLSDVPLSSADGYTVLLREQRDCGAAGKKFLLSNPSEYISTGLRWTGLADFLEVRKEGQS